MDVRHWRSEIAALAAEGAAAPTTPYDAERYSRLAQIAHDLTDGPLAAGVAASRQISDTGSLLMARTPKVAADAAVFDHAGRVLLIQRQDSALWALPGGAAEVGNLPATVAEREVWEETGVVVHAQRVLGLYAIPSRDGSPGYLLYILLFLCRYVAGQPVVTHESLDVGYFARQELPPLHRGHDRRIADAFAAIGRGDSWPAVYD